MAAPRTLALQKLHRICQAEVRTLKARYTLATVKLALSKYRERDPRRRPRSLGLAPKKNAFRPALQLSHARTRRNPRAGTPLTTSASTSDQSNLIPLGSGGFYPNGSRTPGQRPLPPKRHGPHGPDRAQACRDLLQRFLQPPWGKLLPKWSDVQEQLLGSLAMILRTQRLLRATLSSMRASCGVISPTWQSRQRRGHLLEIRLSVLRAENTQPNIDRKSNGMTLRARPARVKSGFEHGATRLAT